MDLEKELNISKLIKRENKKLANKLLSKRPKDLDDVVQGFHEEVFDEIDCMTCGNCCKTTSPAMGDRDIDRLAKHFRMKPAKLIEQHMHLDADNDYVFNGAPCPFLAADNACMVYESRPLACKEYPHTNRKRFYQVVDVSLKNAEVCPAVVRILDKLRPVYLTPRKVFDAKNPDDYNR